MAYGRVGENDVGKPRSPERNPRENARSSMSVEQRRILNKEIAENTKIQKKQKTDFEHEGSKGGKRI